MYYYYYREKDPIKFFFRIFEKSLSEIFRSHKKVFEIYFFLYLRKLSRNWGKFSSTALEVSNIWHKKWLFQAQYKTLDLNFVMIFLSKEKKLYISLFFFSCNFMRPNTSVNNFWKRPKSSAQILFSLGFNV